MKNWLSGGHGLDWPREWVSIRLEITGFFAQFCSQPLGYDCNRVGEARNRAQFKTRKEVVVHGRDYFEP